MLRYQMDTHTKEKFSEQLVRSFSSRPLKDLNYQQPSKNQQMSDPTKQKQKISLTEYRERSKSKSPAKSESDQAKSELDVKQLQRNTGDSGKGDTEDRAGEIAYLANPGIREERAMSLDDALDISVDLANMSIDQTETYLDDKSGDLFQNGEVVVIEKRSDSGEGHSGRSENKLKLKKSVSLTKTNAKEVTKIVRSDKSDSTLLKLTKENSQAVKEKDEKRDFSLSLSERLRIKSGGSQSSPETEKARKSGTSENILTGSPDIIDLTEDEESPVPQPVLPKQSPPNSSVNIKTQDSSILTKSMFGGLNKNPVASFESLNKELARSSIDVPKQSQQWNQPREPAKVKAEISAGFRSASDVYRDSEGSQSETALLESIQQDIARRNQLSALLEKQKGVIAMVKMSELPDKGKRLRASIDSISRNIQDLTIKIKQNTDVLNQKKTASKGQGQTSVGMGQQGSAGSSQPPKQPQIIKIHPNGTAGSSQAPKQPQIIKVYPNGSHQPHNPENLRQTTLLPHVAQIPPHILQQMYAANPQAMQLYGGRMTADRLRQVGSVTKEAIERLHKQLETCPKSTEELEDPTGLLVPLMTHQRQALMWLVWRERQTPSGGILADDMGLGKTLTMISLIVKQQQVREGGSDEEKQVWLNRDKELDKLGKSVVKSTATLIVCPASLIHHWRTEIERRCESGLLRVCMYHGANREQNVLKLASYDVVLTTYNIISKEVELDDKDKKGEEPVKDDEEDDTQNEDKPRKLLPNIMRIAWERIILDEGHNIKNHKSQQSRAVSRLRAGFRWALTGTPIQNDLLDMYSLLRFLRCSPFDEYKVWKRQVDTGNATGHNRLNVIVKTLLLRRTKSQTGATGKPLVPLPEKSSQTHELQLSEQERQVYDKVFAQSRNVLKEYLKRHEEKEMLKDGYIPPKSTNAFLDKGPAASQLAGARTGPTGSQSEEETGVNLSSPPTGQHILVMLLRLRQCCSHLSLMKDALDDETQQNEGLELTLEEQMMDLMLNDDQEKEPAVKKTSQIFEKEALSTKMQALLEQLKAIHKPANSKDKCKSVIVSQWTKMLDIVSVHLQKMNIESCVIQGNIPAKKRMELVDLFNNDKHGPQVMLVSLRAGGCGLNLIGGNHLFLLDSHWNPALEDQACDRIYRVGQKKNVYIHRFLCKDTVEEKILQLQRRKQDLAQNVLTGGAMSKTKLTLQDLRMLFGV